MDISPWGAIYTMEIGKCYKPGVPPNLLSHLSHPTPQKPVLNIHQHTPGWIPLSISILK